MCMQCVGAVGTALQAATLVGGPIVYKHYRAIRARLGLPDTSVAAQQARAAEGAALTSRPATAPIRLHLVPRPRTGAQRTTAPAL